LLLTFVFSPWDFYSLGQKKIIIMDLYSAFRSEDAEALDAALSEFEQMNFQVAFESENVFAQLSVSR